MKSKFLKLVLITAAVGAPCHSGKALKTQVVHVTSDKQFKSPPPEKFAPVRQSAMDVRAGWGDLFPGLLPRAHVHQARPKSWMAQLQEGI